MPPQSYQFIHTVENGPNTLFSKEGAPLMPLNSGDNSVTNQLIYKFLTLTPTQYFFLHQWAVGKFDPGDAPADNHVDVIELDRQVLGTWSEALLAWDRNDLDRPQPGVVLGAVHHRYRALEGQQR